VLLTIPGDEPVMLDALAAGGDAGDAAGVAVSAAAAALREAGAVVLVGERLSGVPGALSAVARLADATGARLAWIPRRAGERGALDAGAFPTLLPGGRPVADAGARAVVAAAWGVDELPAAAGRDTGAIVAAAASGELGALVVGGVELTDLPDPALARQALESAAFVVSLEIVPTAITAMADVVLPVAKVDEKAGTFVDWEGRDRPFDPVFTTSALSDARALSVLADALGVSIGVSDARIAARGLRSLEPFTGARAADPQVAPSRAPQAGAGEAVLATWRELLDRGALQEGEKYLAATGRRPVARVSAATAVLLGIAEGEAVHVATDAGGVTLPLAVSALPDGVVWVPTNSAGCTVVTDLGLDPTVPSIVRLTHGGAA